MYIALFLLTGITLYLTLLPPDRIVTVSIFKYDKLGHALMFGSWTFLLGLIRYVSIRKPLPLLPIFVAGSLFGISVEVLQELLPADRNADPYDALADIIGCLVAVGLLKIITIYSPSGSESSNS